MEPPSAHVTPTEEMINLFDSWDTTKLKNRLRSFNRAKSWFCKVLKCPFPELPEKHNMRQKDNENALELLLEAYSSGLPFEDYIKRGLQGTIIVKTESESNAASSDDEGNDSKDDSFCDAPEIITEETRVAVATRHCEPDCSQCREAAVAGEVGILHVRKIPVSDMEWHKEWVTPPSHMELLRGPFLVLYYFW